MFTGIFSIAMQPSREHINMQSPRGGVSCCVTFDVWTFIKGISNILTDSRGGFLLFIKAAVNCEEHRALCNSCHYDQVMYSII